jgi:hypothetical protein
VVGARGLSVVEVVAGTALLLVRGVFLWLLVPLGVCLWLVMVLVGRADVGLGELLGWMDLNLVASLQRSVFRPFYRERGSWIPFSKIHDVAHRIGFTDPA